MFYRHLKRRLPRIASGRGACLFDEQGKRYLDAAGGAMVVNSGHGNVEFAAAVADQIREIAYVNGMQFTNAAAESLAEELAEILPGALKYSYFLAGGAEAIEAAVKLARQFCYVRGATAKWKIISRHPSYHGSTLTALSLSGREHYRRMYEPLLTDFPYIRAPDSYRHPGCPACTGEVLEEEILKQGPETVAVFLAEPIIGASAGAMVPDPEYYQRVGEICQKYDVLFIADEIAAGMGRTGKWFSFQHYDMVPDIVVLGKGLSGGLVPLSAIIANSKIRDCIANSNGAFKHAQTFSHTPVICTAGLVNLRYIKRNQLVERSAGMEKFFFEQLSRLMGYDTVGDIRGKGLFAGIEFVKDRATKEPFPRESRFAERLVERSFENGLILWPNVGHVDGQSGDLVMVAPPFTVSEEEISEMVSLLEISLEQVS